MIIATAASSQTTPAAVEFALLQSWLASGNALQLSLHEIERQQQARGREVQRLLLQAHLQQILPDAAQDFDAFYRQRSPEPATGTILVAAVDCKGIPMVKPPGAQPTPRLTKGQKANKKRMATVAAVFTRTSWMRTPQQVARRLFRISRSTPEDAPVPPRPENKRVWASLLKGKNAVIQEVAEEMERRDPAAFKTRVALTDGERALQIRVDRKLKVTLILDLMHALQKLWKAAYVFHAEGSLEADLWFLDRTF